MFTDTKALQCHVNVYPLGYVSLTPSFDFHFGKKKVLFQKSR